MYSPTLWFHGTFVLWFYLPISVVWENLSFSGYVNLWISLWCKEYILIEILISWFETTKKHSTKNGITNSQYILYIVMVFNATFNTISVILVEEAGVPEENHRSVASHWQTLSHNVVSSTPHLSGIRTHNDCIGRYKSNYHTNERLDSYNKMASETSDRG
jgi:hypothetical protein